MVCRGASYLAQRKDAASISASNFVRILFCLAIYCEAYAKSTSLAYVIAASSVEDNRSLFVYLL